MPSRPRNHLHVRHEHGVAAEALRGVAHDFQGVRALLRLPHRLLEEEVRRALRQVLPANRTAVREWNRLTRRRRRAVREHHVLARSGRRVGASARGADVLRTVAEVVRGALLNRNVGVLRLHRRDRESHDVGQVVAEHLAACRTGAQVDVADVRTAGVCNEQRVAHDAVTIPRPRRDAPGTRAHENRRLERGVREIEDLDAGCARCS